jgi:hypothetical protein
MRSLCLLNRNHAETKRHEKKKKDSQRGKDVVIFFGRIDCS